MARSKVARQGNETEPTSERRIKAAGPQTITLRMEDVQRWLSLLEVAQRETINAAPREVPWEWTGPRAAIRAFDSLELITRDMHKVLSAASGGAS